MFTCKLEPEDRVTYLPDFQDNRERADEWARNGEHGPKPFFWVELLPLTGRDYNKVAGSEYGNKRKNIIGTAQRVVHRIMAKNVPVVSNLSFEGRNGDVITPRSGGELADVVFQRGYKGLGTIIDDIMEALDNISVAEEGDLKKLRLQYAGSGQATTQATGGDAPDAILNTSTTKMDQQKSQTE